MELTASEQVWQKALKGKEYLKEIQEMKLQVELLEDEWDLKYIQGLQEVLQGK